MSAIFLKILNMSISASYIVLAVLLLHLLLKKAPKWITVILWGIVAIRLVCPFSIESVLSLIPSSEVVSPSIMTDYRPTIDTGIPIINNTLNPVILKSLKRNPGDSMPPIQILIPVLTAIWIVGIAALLIYTVISYAKLRHKIDTAVLYKDNIYQSENVASPFVLGIIKPKIYLPFDISEKDMEHVIAHETAHIRRKDHLWKPLGFLLLAVHWFNPLMWLGYVLLCRDIELACDEKVIGELEFDTRADYSEALLTCSVNRRMITACPIAFGEVGVKNRVSSVLNYKKPAFWSIIAAVVSCIVVAICFLTDPPDIELGIKPNTQDSFTEYDGVYVTLEYTFIEQAGNTVFHVLLHNDTDKQVTYGYTYSIERRNGEKWIDTTSEDIVFNTNELPLYEHIRINKRYSTYGFDVSKPGTYRLVIPFSVEEDGEHEKYHTYLEFDVAAVSEVGEADKPESTYTNTNQVYTFRNGEITEILRILDQGCDISNVQTKIKVIRSQNGNIVFNIEWSNSTPDKLVIGPDFKVYKYDDQEQLLELEHNKVWRNDELSINGATENASEKGEYSYNLSEHFNVTENGYYRFEAYGAWVTFKLTLTEMTVDIF